MKAILFVASEPGGGSGGVDDARYGDVIIRPTTAPSRVLIAGPGSNASTLIVDGSSGNVSVRNKLNATVLGGYGLTLSLPPGVDASNDLDQLLVSGANNPYAWASNAVAQALFESDRSLAASEYASNALHSLAFLQDIPGVLDAVVWTSNQAASLATNAQESSFASNVAVMAYGISASASNAVNAVLSQGNALASNLSALTSNVAATVESQLAPTSNAAFAAQSEASNAFHVAFWASNATRDGYYASNASRAIDAALSNAVARSTSAYLAATTSAGVASWASNASGIAQFDSRRALAQVAAALSNDTSNSSSLASSFAYSSNTAYVAHQVAAAAMSNVGIVACNLSSTQAKLAYSCNIARTALASATAASNVAFPASLAATAASSNAQSALARVLDTVSASNGGTVLGNLSFANQASIVSLASLGVGTAAPEYPVQVLTTAPNSTVSMWLSGDIHTLSDKRDKHQLLRIGSALDRLLAIGGYTYIRDIDSGRAAGVIAQEVMQVLPEAVHTNAATGQLSVAYNCLIPLIIEAFRELHGRFEKYENSK